MRVCCWQELKQHCASQQGCSQLEYLPAPQCDAAADPMPEEGDHPDDLTDEEAVDGEVIYHEVDDLDDDSNGLD